MKLLNELPKLPNPVTMYYSLLFYIPIFPRNNNHELLNHQEGRITGKKQVMNVKDKMMKRKKGKYKKKRRTL